MKFKVGDKVKVIKLKNSHSPEVEIGKETTITSIATGDYAPYEDDQNCFFEEELELIQPKKFTKYDLKERYIVTFRNGKEAVYTKCIVIQQPDVYYYRLSLIKRGKSLGIFIKIENYNDDLTNKYDKDLDIISILKPKYETIWTREEETVKEMTVEEISKELGYEVKIVK